MDRGNTGELGISAKRWVNSREEAADRGWGDPLFRSQEWVDVQLGTKEGMPVNWEEWRIKKKEEKRRRLVELELFPRRRQVRFSTDELGGKERKKRPRKGRMRYRVVAKGKQ